MIRPGMCCPPPCLLGPDAPEQANRKLFSVPPTLRLATHHGDSRDVLLSTGLVCEGGGTEGSLSGSVAASLRTLAPMVCATSWNTERSRLSQPEGSLEESRWSGKGKEEAATSALLGWPRNPTHTPPTQTAPSSVMKACDWWSKLGLHS